MRLEVLFQQLEVTVMITCVANAFCLIQKALVSGHPRDAKKVSVTGAGRLRELKIQSLYESREKRGFVKAAVSRAVRLRECPLGELPVSLNSVSILRAIPCRRKLHSHIRLAAQVYPVTRQKRKRRKIYV